MYAPRRSEAEWREIVAELEASRLTQAAFAQREGINLSTLRWRLSRLRRVDEAPHFVELKRATLDQGQRDAPGTTLRFGDLHLEFREPLQADYLLVLLRGLVDGESPS